MNKKINVTLLWMVLSIPVIMGFSVSAETVSVSVSCQNNIYTGSITTTVSTDGMMVTIEFDPALPDRDCSTITFSGAIVDTFNVRTLVGDTNHDGIVSSADASLIRPWFGREINENNFIYDINVNGSIGNDDFNDVMKYFGKSAPSCSNNPLYITGARSINNHNGTEYGLDLLSNNIEHRTSGVTKIEFDLSTSIKHQLEIDSPEAVTEGSELTVTVTANDIAISDANVIFNDVTRSTNENGIVTFTAPEFTEGSDNEYTITATHPDYHDAGSVTITITEVTVLNKLVINAPSNVDERKPFTVSVSNDGTNEVVESATVSFNEITQLTDSNGEANFTAPEVSTDSPYSISASKSQHTDANTVAITVNNVEETYYGWIEGTVSNSSGLPIKNAKICAKLVSDANSATSRCSFTNEEGFYKINQLQPGSYSVEVSKEGYKTTLEDGIEIFVDEGTALDVILELEDEPEPDTDDSDELNNFVTYGALVGEVSAIIDLKGSIQVFKEYLEIKSMVPAESEKLAVFDIRNEDAGLHKYAINIGEASIGDITVNANGDELSFDSELLGEYLIVAVTVPEGSASFTIEISQVVEGISAIMAIISFIVICAIVGIVIIAPIIYIDRKEK